MENTKNMLYSYHVHSKWSDGSSSTLEVVQRAKEIKLDEIGFSDHLAISPYQKKYSWSMPLENLDSYVLEVEKLKKTYPVELGLETDFFPETVDHLKKIVSNKPFDYTIGSVHSIEEVPLESLNDFSKKELHEIAKKYWRLIYQLAQSRVFDIVGHIDRIKEANFYESEAFSRDIDLALDAIYESKMSVELNTSGWYHGEEQYPSKELLKKCFEKKIPVLVSADAHHLNNLTRDFNKAFMILKELGYSKLPFYEKRKCFFSAFPEGANLS